MNYFEEMIRQRMASDGDELSDAILEMTGSIMGKRAGKKYRNTQVLTKSALEQILRFYDLQIEEWPRHLKGTDEILDYVCDSTGLMRRDVRLEQGWYKKSFGALLVRRKDSQEIVALLPSSLGGYFFWDTSTGKKVRLNKKSEELIEQEAVCFYEALPDTALSFRDLIFYCRTHVRLQEKLSLLLITASGLVVSMIVPPLTSLIYTDVMLSESMTVLMAIVVFLLTVNLSKSIMEMLKTHTQKRIASKLSVKLQAAFMMRLLLLPATFFRNYSEGELSARVEQVTVLCEKLVSGFVLIAYTLLGCTVWLLQILLYSPGAFVSMLACTLIMLLVIFFIVRSRIRQKELILDYKAKEHGAVYGSLLSINKIRLTGSENHAFSEWAKLYARQAKVTFDPGLWTKINQAVPEFLSLLMLGCIYYFLADFGAHPGIYFAVMSCYGLITGALSGLTQSADDLASIWPSYDLIRPILDEIPEDAGTRKPVAELSGQIRLRNVTFSYSPDEPPVLKHLNLLINPGQYVAIVGSTGCGKSTLVRLLLGFEQPQAGTIYYDERPMGQLNLKSLRSRIGTVLQDGKLFIGDIYSNIALCKPGLTEEEAWEAARMAGIDEDIRRMPMGMRTLISEENGGISGGQKQRLMIARAIAPRPRILIFDEATSALDNLSQQIVTESLDHLGCTRLVIAHRLSTIRSCERILVLDQGNIIADGTYDELLRTCPFFTELVNRQTLDE